MRASELGKVDRRHPDQQARQGERRHGVQLADHHRIPVAPRILHRGSRAASASGRRRCRSRRRSSSSIRTDLEQLGVKYDLGSSNQFFNKLMQRPDPNGEPGDDFTPSNVNVVDLGGNGRASPNARTPTSALPRSTSCSRRRWAATRSPRSWSALERVELSDVQAEPVITTLDSQEGRHRRR